ncbi:TRAP transporter permease [Marinivivus vitaminiproducens]|uniref:TRAP transporter permease n=1 Tax=Marinivivus vitaminiproducens TaxID=3035935 RepID=UPI0027A17B9B|nr:TRAP transporter permease [Geminicoccaceae bacterium SCSIO 64248]
MTTVAQNRPADLAALEAAYDPEMQFRSVLPPTSWLVAGLLVALSVFHYYTAGFGLFREATHRGIHLAFVLGLIFLVFGFRRGRDTAPSMTAPGGVPWYDWLLAVAAAAAALYVPWEFHDLAFRIGNPNTADLAFGSIMVVLVLEAARRSMGWALPAIAVGFIVYAIWGQVFPGALVHPGTTWSGLVNHLYLTSQGIYGVAVGVVATFVFHFVLFGVLANRIGAGQLFIDLASCIAGRYAGGPAKVSVVSSGLLGMISGSSIANTVTTGALTIPAMKRVGYRPHFAAGVEATASTGGQITPPVMGAAAFLMVEFLEIPYREILLAALVPALMHYLGVFTMVHLEAKRLGLRGLSDAEVPRAWQVIKADWPALIPLVVLVAIIMSGRTPFLAAFWAITLCILVGALDRRKKLGLGDLIDAFQLGARYALAVGAAAAAVGIIVGVVTLTGMGFKVSFMITSTAAQIGGWLAGLQPVALFTQSGLTLLLTLLFTAFACILLGAGIPTTATYIILVSIAAPALTLLGTEPIVAHFFVFYYGVLADITPPVALAAYAAAGIAGCNPFQAGTTAFRLAAAKALVPFVFVYAPSMLIVTEAFTWGDFLLSVTTCIVGIVLLGGALTGYLMAPMGAWQRLLLGVAALCLVFPGWINAAVGVLLALPVALAQMAASRTIRTARDG